MTLKRPRQVMPDDISQALRVRGLQAAYEARPDYQRNDYLLWIGEAKRQKTRAQRVAQMLDELEDGDLYMKMLWRPGVAGASKAG